MFGELSECTQGDKAEESWSITLPLSTRWPDVTNDPRLEHKAARYGYKHVNLDLLFLTVSYDDKSVFQEL